MSVGTWAKASIVVSVLGLLSVAVGHLALTDIYHAEGDVSLEWSVLRACFATIFIAQLSALVTLVKVARRNARPDAA